MSRTFLRATKIAFALACACALAFCLASCGSGNNASSSESNVLAIGEKTDNTYELHLTNGAGKSVTNMVWRLEGSGTYSANMMSSSKHLEDGAEAVIYIPKGTVTNGEYCIDLKVTFSDGGTSTLHHLDLEDFDTCTLYLQGKVGYVRYQSTAAKRMVSTLELQVYYYNLEDPEAEARDKEEEEEEKRRLEKLEEDLKGAEEELESSTSSASSASSASGTTSSTNSSASSESSYQGADVEDVPLEDYDSDGREYFDGDDSDE